MASAARKRARTAGEDGGSDGGGVAVADGFEAPLFGARVVGQVTTLPLEGEDGPPAAGDVKDVVSDHAGAWYGTTKDSVLHVSAAGRVRSHSLQADGCNTHTAAILGRHGWRRTTAAIPPASR